jgi:dTDP-glucose 4,6-dehydratase
MRVLITGGAGFIGSHLADRLVEEGHEVVCLDNFSTGRRMNLAANIESANLEVVEADVVEPLPDMGRFGLIFHLASPVTCIHHVERPIATLRAAAEGTRRVLDLAAQCRATFVLASTSEVYGDPLVHPQVETDVGHVSPIGPRSPYDEGKRFAEALTAAYGRERGVSVRIARIFNTYGPRMRLDDGRVVTNFIRQALAGADLTVYGDGSQTRSFCYIDDQVEGLVRLAASDYCGPVNIGNPDEITVRQLAEEIVQLTGSRSKIVQKPLPADDPKVRRPDIALAKKLLGWEPKVDRSEGLKRTVAFCREALGAR